MIALIDFASIGEESPGSIGKRCRITSGEGNLRESATESKPPLLGEVRVKGCGKSAPREWQQSWHGKPHLEQDQIGMGAPVYRASDFDAEIHSGWLLEPAGNIRPRGMIIRRTSPTEPGLYIS